MALIFQRLARNFVCNGYFPTDSDTLGRILTALTPAEHRPMRILDPCAGEGVALAECKRHLNSETTQTFGIEYHEERAWHAKSILDKCLHADFQNCLIGQRSFGLLFLNPPYGDLIADKGETGDNLTTGRKRLEKLFYFRAFPTLQYGGVLIFIIPSYSLDKELCNSIANHFSRVEVFSAPETRFKQVVIFGVRKHTEDTAGNTDVRNRLLQVGQGELPPLLPIAWDRLQYQVPAITTDNVKFQCVRLDAKQLAEEIKKSPCLWPQFTEHFSKLSLPTRRPLMNLSNWHLALTLAAGHVSGLVTASDGRSYLIKGDTHKETVRTLSFQQIAEDELIEVITERDRFVPVIRAIDMSQHSEHFGKVITIK